MRRGIVTAESEKILESLNRPPKIVQDSGIVTTHLFAMVREVENHNIERLENLTGPSQTFESIDAGQEYDLKHLDNTRAPKFLKLKLGAQVMLIKNIVIIWININRMHNL